MSSTTRSPTPARQSTESRYREGSWSGGPTARSRSRCGAVALQPVELDRSRKRDLSVSGPTARPLHLGEGDQHLGSVREVGDPRLRTCDRLLGERKRLGDALVGREPGPNREAAPVQVLSAAAQLNVAAIVQHLGGFIPAAQVAIQARE